MKLNTLFTKGNSAHRTTTVTPAALKQSPAVDNQAPVQREAPLPSGAKKRPSVAITGLGTKSIQMSNGAPQAGQAGSSYIGNIGVATDKDGPVDRGRIEVSAQPIDANAFQIDVKTFHSTSYSHKAGTKYEDKITLTLQVRVQDGDKEGIITLAILADDQVLNTKSTYRGEHSYVVEYDAIDAYLKKLNPNLKLNNNTQLAVYAKWAVGHEWGGFGRMGEFFVPPRPEKLSLIDVQTGKRASMGANMPLDLTYKVPDSVFNDWNKSISSWNNKAKLETILEKPVAGKEGTGIVTTRLESEVKGEADEKDVEQAVAQLYKFANDPKLFAAHFGPDWKIEPVSRYWRKDEQGNPIESPRMAKLKAQHPELANVFMGDPDPLLDNYKGKKFLEEGWVWRTRSNETKAGLLNVKYGLGRLDTETGIRQRVEFGACLAPGAKEDDVAKWIQEDTSHYNPVRLELARAFPNLDLKSQLKPVVELTAERHRFLFTHKSGVHVEWTGDFTRGKSADPADMQNGKARESYICGFEAELDHLNFGQGNQGQTTQAASSLQTFKTEQEQSDWTKKLSKEATLSVPPRFHGTDDLENEAFRQSTDYQLFSSFIAKLKPVTFPQGVRAARQKGQAAAAAMGLITPKK